MVARHHNETSLMSNQEKPLKEGFSFTLWGFMKVRTRNTRIISSKELLSILHRSAVLYSEYADSTLLFIFKESKNAAYDYYEVRFCSGNFMHLAGVRSRNLSACEFYTACLNDTITVEDCTPRRDPNTMYAKVAVMEQLLDLRNSKCYKIGEKDLITRDNDFEMATGNANGVIGYDARVKQRGTNHVDRTKAPIPTTLLNSPITDYCSRPQKIMFILQKTDGASTYSKLFYEIKKDLLQTEMIQLPDRVRALITL